MKNRYFQEIHYKLQEAHVFLMIIVYSSCVFFSSQYCLIAWWLLGMTLGLERWLPPMFSLCKCRKWKKWRDTNMYSIKYLWWHGWSKEILLRYRNLWKLWDMYISFQQFASWWFVTLSGAAGALKDGCYTLCWQRVAWAGDRVDELARPGKHGKLARIRLSMFSPPALPCLFMGKGLCKN